MSTSAVRGMHGYRKTAVLMTAAAVSLFLVPHFTLLWCRMLGLVPWSSDLGNGLWRHGPLFGTAVSNLVVIPLLLLFVMSVAAPVIGLGWAIWESRLMPAISGVGLGCLYVALAWWLASDLFWLVD